jgi:SOS-response transcriptional repressor LexA
VGNKGIRKRGLREQQGNKRRRNIMIAIKDYTHKKGYPPTFKEIEERVQLLSKVQYIDIWKY